MANHPVSKKTPPARPVAKGGRPAGLFTWIAVGVVVLVVAALVIVKVTGNSSATSGSTSFQAADPAIVSEVTQIPDSVFNSVGVTSTVVPVTAPTVLKGQSVMTATTSTGTMLPEVFYVGADFCPYCAAERWATIAALSRFGTFSGLGDTASYSGDFYPSTQSFTFSQATYTSKYVVFKSVETYTNVVDSKTNYYYPLEKLTSAENAEVTKYDAPKYIPTETADDAGSIPFISFGNQVLIAGSSYTPATLSGLSRSAIAADLSDPTNPVTAAIIATANYQTAAICHLTNQQPSNVCTSPGVAAAQKAMGLTK